MVDWLEAEVSSLFLKKNKKLANCFVGKIEKKLSTIYSIFLSIKTYFVHVLIGSKKNCVNYHTLSTDRVAAAFTIVDLNLETLSFSEF